LDSASTQLHPTTSLIARHPGPDASRIALTYTYQSVGEFQLPEQVSINCESHHEV
jgi:hypothetical protein